MRWLALVAVLLLAAAASVSADVLYTRSHTPEDWIKKSAAPASAEITFILALKQQNLNLLESRFWSVSDPNSFEYRQFLSINEISSIIAPREEDVQIVTNWLLSQGVAAKQIDSLGDALEVTTTVAIAEQLFSTRLYEFVHTSGKSILRQYGSYSVPSDIRQRIDFVSGLSTFPVPHYPSHRRVVSTPSADLVGVVAQTVYGIYNIPSQITGSAVQSTSQGVIEFEQQTFKPDDLTSYSQLLGIPITPVPASQIIGPNVNVSETESILDIDLITTVNTEASNWFWLEAGNNWLYAFATHFFSTTKVPQVISISYGWYEGAQCDINPTECSSIGVDSHAYVARVNTEFQKIGLRGVSILVSSGDSGAHTRTDNLCTAKTLRAEFPAASPYITSVGATQLDNPTALSSQPQLCSKNKITCAASGTEVAVSLAVSSFTSGGGFSEVSAQPSYQSAAVSAYFKSGVTFPPASYYNSSNRGGPDVAAVGHNNLILQNGQVFASGGTSAAAPIFAAVVALLNQESIASTGQPLGFLNPLLYQAWAAQPNTFNDITSGDNKCSEGGCYSWCQGWYATKGWDPVTGLGTPNYGNLLKYLQKLNSRQTSSVERS